MSEMERRHFPRIADEDFAINVQGTGFDLVAHTLNISASGIYCKVEKELPLMSRVNLRLIVPDAKSAKTIDVSGVVVREHPVIIDGRTKHYDVAIFFDDLLQKDRDIISSYITKKKR